MPKQPESHVLDLPQKQPNSRAAKPTPKTSWLVTISPLRAMPISPTIHLQKRISSLSTTASYLKPLG